WGTAAASLRPSREDPESRESVLPASARGTWRLPQGSRLARLETGWVDSPSLLPRSPRPSFYQTKEPSDEIGLSGLVHVENPLSLDSRLGPGELHGAALPGSQEGDPQTLDRREGIR